MKRLKLGIVIVSLLTTVVHANSALSCNSLEASVNMTCPNNIMEHKNVHSVVIGDLEDMKYKCRQQNCSNAQNINQGLFLLKDAFQQYDKAYLIGFSNSKCLKKGENYIFQIEQKIKACKTAEKNIETFQTLF